MIERYFSYHFLYFLLISSWKKLGQQNMLCKNGGCVTMKIQDESGCYVQQRQVRQIWVCSIKESAKSFVWDGITLCTSTVQTAGKRLYRNWEYWWNTHWIQCNRLLIEGSGFTPLCDTCEIVLRCGMLCTNSGQKTGREKMEQVQVDGYQRMVRGLRWEVKISESLQPREEKAKDRFYWYLYLPAKKIQRQIILKGVRW